MTDEELKQGEMSDHQKGKHDFARHQDALLWSRPQLIGVIQAATLAGTYGARNDPWMLVPLALPVVGAILTVLVVCIMWRDDAFGSRAFEDSKMPITMPPPGWKGRTYFVIGVALLLACDAGLFVRILFRP